MKQILESITRLSAGTLIALGFLALITGAAAATVGVAFTDTVNMSVAEVEYEESDLYVSNYDTNGPGATVDEIVVKIQNPTDDAVEANVSAWLLQDNEEVSDGEVEVLFDENSETEITIELERTAHSQFDETDILIEEL